MNIESSIVEGCQSGLRERLARRGLVLDGGLATELEFQGLTLHPKLWSASALLQPERLALAQRAFVEAGAEVVCTATYQATVAGLEEHLGIGAERAADLLRGSVSSARDATEGSALVAASVGPYGAVLADGSEYRGDYSPPRAELRRFHAERLDLLLEGEPDLVALETIPSGRELALLLELAAERPAAVVWLALSVDGASSLADGTAIGDALLRDIEQAGIAAVGVNCLAPEKVAPALSQLRALTDLPLVAYPNSGEVWGGGRWTGAVDDQIGRRIEEWWGLGARVVGGCCRTRPQAVKRVRDRVDALRRRQDSSAGS